MTRQPVSASSKTTNQVVSAAKRTQGFRGPREAGEPGSATNAIPLPTTSRKFGHDFSGVPAGHLSWSPSVRQEVPLSLPLDAREGTFSPDLQKIIAALGPGESLSPTAKAPLQRASPVPLDGVRIHDDRGSRLTASLLNSEAFTVGNHIVLGSPPDASLPRDRLVAHEVGHAIQQHPSTAGPRSQNPEREADRFADSALLSSRADTVLVPMMDSTPVGLARRVIWKHIEHLPNDLMLIIDVDDGDFVGGCVAAIVPHMGVKLIKKHPHTQLFNLHLGILTNTRGQTCIFFYESVTRICEMKCFDSLDELKEKLDEILEWLAEMLKKVFLTLAIMALIVAAAVLAYLIAEALVAALAVLLLLLA